MLCAVDVAIRPVEIGDLTGVLRLTPRLLIGVDPSRPVDLVRTTVKGWVKGSVQAARSDTRGGWVAVVEQNIVGFVSVAEDEHWCGQPDAYVGELIVAEQYEGQGIARSLMAQVEEWAYERGLGHVRLSTGAANVGARAFYERLGYAESDVTFTRQFPLAVDDVLQRPSRSGSPL
jgi:ribosomal protein S18 acetylase RimI-like enzyme